VSNQTAGGYARRNRADTGTVPEQRGGREGNSWGRRGGPADAPVQIEARPPKSQEQLLVPVRGPRHERHLLSAEELGAMAVPVGDDGVVIGTDPANQRAVLNLFRPKATDLALVGGSYLARLLALRAAATGARIVVETARPELWGPLAQNAGGGQPVVTIAPVRRVGALGASAAVPVLLIRDCGARPPKPSAPKSAWQSTLTLLPFLDPGYASQLYNVDLLALQRISPQEAQLAARVARIGPEDVRALPTLLDELTLWCARRGRQYVYTAPTQLEIGLFGAPQRVG
jgi:hypothetical protein